MSRPSVVPMATCYPIPVAAGSVSGAVVCLPYALIASAAAKDAGLLAEGERATIAVLYRYTVVG